MDLLSTSVFSAVIEDLGNLSALLRHLYHAFIELSSVSSRRSEGALFHFVRYVTLAEHKGLMWGSLVQSELARRGREDTITLLALLPSGAFTSLQIVRANTRLQDYLRTRR